MDQKQIDMTNFAGRLAEPRLTSNRTVLIPEKVIFERISSDELKRGFERSLLREIAQKKTAKEDQFCQDCIKLILQKASCYYENEFYTLLADMVRRAIMSREYQSLKNRIYSPVDT